MAKITYSLQKKTIRDCKQVMSSATNYQTWHEAALELDLLEGNDEWKQDKSSPHYKYQLIEERLHRLRQYRESKDILDVIYHLREGLHQNLGNICNPQLYNKSHTGTKQLIEDYIQEVVTNLNEICDNDYDFFSKEQKIQFFRDVFQAYGRNALLLSGGATLGIFHLGVIKVLWEQNLLPHVISGSSAGSIIAALIGVAHDRAFPQIFEIEDLPIRIWKIYSPQKIWSHKHLINSEPLRQTIQNMIGEKTFQEAYEKTGRSLNITVSPNTKNQMPRLLNHLTSPHIYIWTAVLASCAIPGFFPPVPLLAKDRFNSPIAYMPPLKWVDGSLKGDLPMLRLSRLYNVNRYITSQANPYVLPFINKELPMKENKLSRLLQSEAKVVGGYLLDSARAHVTNDMVDMLLDSAGTLITQSYLGDITVHPQSSLSNYKRVLSDPTPEDIHNMIQEGERATWYKLSMIRNQTRISHTLSSCLKRLLK
ncbi:DUF3336 domain-containing protein [Deltaproteobacteria bacterium TL4]